MLALNKKHKQNIYINMYVQTQKSIGKEQIIKIQFVNLPHKHTIINNHKIQYQRIENVICLITYIKEIMKANQKILQVVFESTTKMLI